jgi:hypothetical protein
MKKAFVFPVVMAILLITASLASAYTAGLQGYWRLDEGSGTKAHDSVNANSGTIHGAVFTTDHAPISGSTHALAFDDNDYVQIPNDPASFESPHVTVSAWVNATTPGITTYVVAKGIQGRTAASYALYTGDRGGLQFYVFNGTRWAMSPSPGTGVWNGEWHHTVGTFDGSVVRLYVDGVQVGTGTNTDVWIAYELPDGNDLSIGAYWIPDGFHFNGLIDEVAIWTRALTADEIADLYTAQIIFDVDIDIKPGSYPNCFNSNDHGVIPVAVLSTADFDASTIDPFSLSLDGAGVRIKGKSGNAGSLEDINADGLPDLVVQIIDDAVYVPGDAMAYLTGATYEGVLIEGTDSICIVP